MSEKYMEFKLDLPNECYFPGIKVANILNSFFELFVNVLRFLLYFRSDKHPI